MYKIKNLLLLFILMLGITAVNAQDTLYYEFFTDGSMNLDWFTPWEGGDEMQVDYQPGNPSGDDWVGFIENGLSGGGVGTALAGTSTLTDYEIRANLYCTINTGTYHAVLARWDTTGGYNSYYYLRTDFDANQRIQLRKFPGASGMGETIYEWVGAQIPGGVPTADGWHELALKLESNQLSAYYDGNLLSGSPFTDSYLSSGFFGIYCFNFMGTYQTTCDDIVILGDAGPQPFDFTPSENTMLDENMEEMSMRAAEGQTVHFELAWDALNGTSTSAPFDIMLEMDDVQIFTTTNPGVEPSSSHTTTSSAWTAAIGEHTLRWTLDSGDAIAEGNEDNNVLEETFLVLDVDAYDLQIDSAKVVNEGGYPVNWIAVDDELYFSLYWSAPMGQGSSGPFSNAMSLDGSAFYSETLFGITQQGDYVTTTDVPYIAESGFHYFMWYLDSDDWVNEFNESNNFTMDGFEPELGVNDPWDDALNGVPSESRISAVYPNPFNPSVTLRYENVTADQMSIVVYDINGREVVRLYNGLAPAGIGQVTWEAEGLASGAYYAVMTAGEYRSVQPLIYVK